MAATEYDVLGVGHGTEDHVYVVDASSAPGEKVRAREYFVQPGGQVPTALAALQGWGARTRFIGPIGDDPGGRRQLDSLREVGVSVSGCPECPGVPSQRSFIAIDRDSGERTIHWYRDERLRLTLDRVDPSEAAAARYLLLDGEDLEVAIELATVAGKAGNTVVLDVDEPRSGIDRLLRVSDVAIVPAGFVESFTAKRDPVEGLRTLCDRGPRVAIATLGRSGAVGWSDGRAFRQPAFPVETVDTTSAGDLFHAGFIFRAMDGAGLEDCLRFAAAAAARSAAAMGGRRSIPPLSAVRALLESA